MGRVFARLLGCCVGSVILGLPALAQTEDVPNAVPAKDEKAAVRRPAPADELLQNNKKFQSLESFSRALYLLENLYVEPEKVKSDELIEKAIAGMVSALDPHTVYLPPTDLKDFAEDTAGRFGGVGVVIAPQADGRLEVVEILEGTPAARSPLKVGDIIHSVDGLVATERNSDEASSRIRGVPGSLVEIEVIPAAAWREAKKKGGTQPLEKLPIQKIKLEREIIRTSSVSHVELSKGYLYTRISVFQENTGENLDTLLRSYEEKEKGQLRGLILDLRNNPGGLLNQAVKVADLFLENGIIVSTIGREREKQEVEYATKRTTHAYMPLVVLVNERSASASEIVAGALQDHKRAVLIGTQTFGKGSVQSVLPLPNGGGVKVTVARYFTPKGKSIQARGITPDIVVASTSKAVAGGPDASMREVDLKGHIEANDLPDAIQTSSAMMDIEAWPDNFKQDRQLQLAYTYLKSASRFVRGAKDD